MCDHPSPIRVIEVSAQANARLSCASVSWFNADVNSERELASVFATNAAPVIPRTGPMTREAIDALERELTRATRRAGTDSLLGNYAKLRFSDRGTAVVSSILEAGANRWMWVRHEFTEARWDRLGFRQSNMRSI
jgi:hypothetical protein